MKEQARVLASLAYMVIAGVAFNTRAFSQASEPLLQKGNLVYQGAFRLPQAPCAAQTYTCFNYGGTAITYDPADNSLFVVGHPNGQLSAEVSIPAAIKSADLGALNTATLLQPFADPAEGARDAINPHTVNPNRIGGQLVYGDRLIFSAYSYYDGAGTQSSSHFTRPLNLSVTGQVSGPYKVGPQYPGFVSGYMTPVPVEWQGQLGGPALTGNCCLAITSQQSNGPAASTFDPATLGGQKPAPAIALVGYPHESPLGSGWSTQNSLFNGTTQITGIVFPAGTRSVLFFGRQGTGPFCYGAGTPIQSLDGTPTGHGPEVWCYDPSNSNKGTHAYPYAYQVWAYDANDLLAVKRGSKAQYAIKPYATWTFNLPFEKSDTHFLGGAAYDAQHQLIYVSQLSADDNANPIIHVFNIDAAAKIPSPPTNLQVH